MEAWCLRFVLAVSLLGWSSAFADERREFYNGIRAQGMGGASVATVNDETALVLNPAALGRLRDFYGTIVDPELDFSWKITDFHRAHAFSQPFDMDEVMRTMTTNQGEYYHARLQMMPSFVAPNFGIGILMKKTLDMEVRSATEADTFYQDDLSLLLGYNLRLWDGRIKIGVTGKLISRIELNETGMSPTQPMDLPSLGAADKLTEGVGFGTDIGLMLTAPWAMLPTLGLVLRDFGGTSFDMTSGVRNKDATLRPDSVAQDLDAGISISPIHGKGHRSVWTIEYRGILTASEESDKAKLIHVGMEYNYGDVVFLRAGYHQRYWTAGAELASEQFQFQIASYGEEIGDETKPREDRRYALKIAFRF